MSAPALSPSANLAGAPRSASLGRPGRALLAALCGLASIGALTSPPQAQADQARSSAVVTWDGTCSGGERLWWDDMCMAWRKRLGSKGWSTWKRNYSQVYIDRYVDPAISPWGFDNSSTSGFDGGQAALLCTHGGRDDNGWWGKMHTQSQGECGANVDQWKAGVASGGKTRFLQLSSCNSMRWSTAGSWFGPAAGGVHSVHGFHGLMYIGSGYVDEYEDQVDDAYSGQSVSESWVDNMHHDPIIGHTICPVSMSFGNSKGEALTRLYGETYAAPTGEKAATNGVLMWMSECDPEDAGALPK